jgi:hypothetical protein
MDKPPGIRREIVYAPPQLSIRTTYCYRSSEKKKTGRQRTTCSLLTMLARRPSIFTSAGCQVVCTVKFFSSSEVCTTYETSYCTWFQVHLRWSLRFFYSWTLAKDCDSLLMITAEDCDWLLMITAGRLWLAFDDLCRKIVARFWWSLPEDCGSLLMITAGRLWLAFDDHYRRDVIHLRRIIEEDEDFDYMIIWYLFHYMSTPEW